MAERKVGIVVVVITWPAWAVASLQYGPLGWLVSRGWQLAETDPVSLRSWSVQRAQDDQDDVSSSCQVNDRVLGQLGNVGRCVLDSPQYLSELSYVAKY